jgi:hypothetical protein
MTFPPAPTELPPEMAQLIVRLAELWAQEASRPQPARDVLEHWDRLIADWAEDPSLPLYVRKVKNDRGSCIEHHSTHRCLVPTDNSPAQWAFALAVVGEKPSLGQVRQCLQQDGVPVAMVLNASERTRAGYQCLLSETLSPNLSGWKVCHLEGVGLARRTLVSEIDDITLREHFRKLMAPSNMFLVPKKYGGLGELPEFCQAIRQLLEPR